MPTALLVLGGSHHSPPIAADLRAAGLDVVESGIGTEFVQHLLVRRPDFVVLHQDAPDGSLFDSVDTVRRLSPRPVVVFTLDPDADQIARALEAGVHAYVVDGYNAGRLRSVIHLAQARFGHDQQLREELAEIKARFEERKLVDRAKGILMGARQLREEEAYRVLRRVAMTTKQRVGQVSQRVIEAARYAEAINRSGQLRMVSQRLAKLYLLAGLGVGDGTADQIAAAAGQADDLIQFLEGSLSKTTFGDLLDGVSVAWAALKHLLTDRPAPARFARVDAAAENVLRRSEQLTDNLEVSGFAQALHAINVAGRQRMLSQRVAKATILASRPGTPSAAAEAQAARLALIDGLDFLRALPLSNPEIDAGLHRAEQVWASYDAALGRCAEPDGLLAIAALSEAALDAFDRLTTSYERAMQAFVD